MRDALYRSLIEGPLLLSDLPEAVSFPQRELALPEGELPPLNLAQKLGHLYEDALAVLLEASPRYQLLTRNLPLRKDAQTTVGELDFLLRDHETDGRLVHLELATKFYLAVPDPTGEGFALPGPDARDNYPRKLDRLRSHQLGLASRYPELLPERYRHESPPACRQLVYGCLFDHVEATRRVEPESAAPGGRRGRWLRIDELPAHFPLETTRFEVIPKPLWPVPFALLEGIPLERWTPSSSLERGIMMRVDGGSDPVFVMPAGYPG